MDPVMPIDDGPATLFALDPAALAIGASTDADTLNKMRKFATDLQHYVGLVQAQRAATNGVADVVASEEEEAGVESVKEEVSSDPGGDQQIDDETNDKHTMDEAERAVVVKQEVKEKELENNANEIPKDEAAQTLTGSSRPLKRVKRYESQSSASVEARRPRLYQSYDGSLDQSSLARSEGRTRKVLNANLAKLGLTAKFSMGVVSKRGARVSHLTLHHNWNDLPRDSTETMEWWLGEGPKRLALASALDPSKCRQSSVAVFWAERKTNGAGLCHYVGHFECIGIEPIRVTFKGEPRQALIELRFCQFDTELANSIAGL